MGPRNASPFSASFEKIISKHPAAFRGSCYLSMVLSNSLLSFGSLSLPPKLWILVFGILFPFSLVLLEGKGKPADRKPGPFPSPPPWLWASLALAAVGLRFYRLSTLSSWPLVDEGFYGYFATLQEEKWDWQWVHGFAQLPVLYTWGLFLCFKFLGNSPFALWFFPAICSVLCVPAAWWAGRKIFGSSLGWVAGLWMALSFWPLYMGRFGTQNILMVLWEFLALGALARCLDAPKGDPGFGRLLLLAAVTGIGFYIYLGWPVVALAVVLALFFNPAGPWAQRFKAALVVLACGFLVALPLGLAALGDYRGYFYHLWAAGSPGSWNTPLHLPLAYVQGLFWGCDTAVFSYGPLWGGLLNPLLGALVFFGLASLLKDFRKPLHLFLLGSLLLFFLPAALTDNFEMMRLAPLLPVLAAIGVKGIAYLLGGFRPPARPVLLGFLFLTSLVLDLRHLFIVYPPTRAGNPSTLGAYKTPEFEQAYSLLKAASSAQGPGLILLNFMPDPYDQTLFTFVYGFNAAANSRFDPSSASWAAVLANIHEQPYLKKLFPGGRWTWLSEGMGRPDGGLILEITPVTPGNRGTLMKWLAADGSLGEVTRLVMELGVDPDQSAMFAALDQAYPRVKGDRLLESRYWRIYALHQAAAGQPSQAVLDEEKAITLGYPMAHLENESGCLLFKQGRRAKAKEAFERALVLKPNCTNAAGNLANLAPR